MWEFDPDARTVSIYSSPDSERRTFTIHDVLDGGNVLPGFLLPLKQLFDELEIEVKP